MNPAQVFTVSTATALVLTTTALFAQDSGLSDAAMRKIRNDAPGITEGCLMMIKVGGIAAMPNRTDRCFKMTKPQRWRGLWLDAFEGQHFCPAPARSCSDDGRQEPIWISFPGDVKPMGREATNRIYVIEFVGRRTLLPGPHGHMGMSAHEIVVDKLISVSPLGR